MKILCGFAAFFCFVGTSAFAASKKSLTCPKLNAGSPFYQALSEKIKESLQKDEKNFSVEKKGKKVDGLLDAVDQEALQSALSQAWAPEFTLKGETPPLTGYQSWGDPEADLLKCFYHMKVPPLKKAVCSVKLLLSE